VEITLSLPQGSKDPSGSMTDMNSGVSDMTAGSMADVTGGAITDVGGASMTRERDREQHQYTRERERELHHYDVTGGSVTDVAAPAAPEQGLDAPGLDLSSLVLSLSSTFVLEKQVLLY